MSTLSSDIMAIFVTDEKQLLFSGVPTILAKSADEQESLATEFARFMHGWVHKLSNGVILVTKE